MTSQTRVCSKCGEEKLLTDFYRDKQKLTGRRPDCKKCNTAACSKRVKKNREHVNFNSLKFATGVDKNTYYSLLEEQGGKCAICGITETRPGRKLSVDHCHSSFLVRGLLCVKCNFGLGYFKDSKINLENAVLYLNKNLSYRGIKYKNKKVDKNSSHQ